MYSCQYFFISSPSPSCPIRKVPPHCLSSDSYHSLAFSKISLLPSSPLHNPSSMWRPVLLPKKGQIRPSAPHINLHCLPIADRIKFKIFKLIILCTPCSNLKLIFQPPVSLHPFLPCPLHAKYIQSLRLTPK